MSRKAAQTPRSTTARRWLNEDHLVSQRSTTDWKKEYRIRHNWSNGACDVKEVIIDKEPHEHPVVADMHDGVVLTADQTHGVRAWSVRGEEGMLHSAVLQSDQRRPTTITIDIRHEGERGKRFCIGFSDGTLDVFGFDRHDGFHLIAQFCEPQQESIKALSMAWPLVMTLSPTQRLRIFDCVFHTSSSTSPRPVLEIQANKPYWPTSVSLRAVSDYLLISIAYIEPTFFSGHNVGIQELKISNNGHLIHTRTALAPSNTYRPLTASCAAEALRPVPAKLEQRNAGPLSLSHSHPYLLVSQPDRTLSLYMVTSTPESLSISSGRTLWGHSSSVSGAHIGKRGKAVSASKRGNELLIWELENELPLSLQQADRYEDRGVSAQQVRKAEDDSTRSLTDGSLPWSLDSVYDGRIASGWLGFDSENAVVLRNDDQGRHILTIYDFT